MKYNWDIPRNERDGWKQKLQSATTLNKPATPLDPHLVKEVMCGLFSGPEVDVEKPRIVRVFTSSTFTDTKEERNALMVDVYPYLRELCQKLDHEFQIVDMRWGVRDEATEDHMTSYLCMTELKKCQTISVATNFVTFLGDKYGYRPFPSIINNEEFEEILTNLRNLEEDAALLETWFKLDTNAVPPVRVLQPIRLVLPDYSSENEDLRKAARQSWWETFTNMQQLLRKGSETFEDKHIAHKYRRSVTEEEIYNGILSSPNLQKVFVFRRNFAAIDNQNQLAPLFIDMSSGKVDLEAQELLAQLKDNVTSACATAGKEVFKYDVAWHEGGLDPNLEAHQDHIRQLCEDFCEAVSDTVLNSIMANLTEKDPVFQEVMAHSSFVKQKCSVFLGRNELLRSIHEYLAGESTRTFVVAGDSGTGKTSVVAKACEQAKNQFPNSVVTARFIGTTGNSSVIRDLLHSVCGQITRAYEQPLVIPEDYDDLIETFAHVLGFAKESQPLIVFLDSLDQLSYEDNAHNLRWLPFNLPQYVKIIVSSILNSDCMAVIRQKSSEAEILKIPLLDSDNSREMLMLYINDAKRTLTPAQIDIANNWVAANPTPIFLKLASDQAKTWKSYSNIDPEALAKSTTHIIEELFLQLERMHGRLLVRRALAYITLAHHGLSETELVDILSCDDEVLQDVYQYWVPPIRMFPGLLWVRIKNDIGSYLVERPRYAWYHRQFWEVAEKYFLSDPKEREYCHKQIANYFNDIWSNGKEWKGQIYDRKIAHQPLVISNTDPKNPLYNKRKVDVLPYHLVKAGEVDEARQVLCNLDFIEAKCAAGLTFDLVQDFINVTTTSQELTHTRTSETETQHLKAELTQYSTFVRLNARFFNSFPTTVYQQAFNGKGQLSKEAHKKLSTPGFAHSWLELNNKDTEFQQYNLNITGHSDGVLSTSFSHDGRFIVTTSHDGTFRVCNAESGIEVANYKYFPDVEIPDDLLKSRMGDTSTIVHVINLHVRPISIFWIDFEGKESFYLELVPGNEGVLQTYVGHLWRVRDDKGKQLPLIYPQISAQIHFIKDPAGANSHADIISRANAELPTQVKINNCSDHEIEVFYYSEDGQMVPFYNLAPGENTSCETYVGTIWRIIQGGTKKVLGTIISTATCQTFAVGNTPSSEVSFCSGTRVDAPAKVNFHNSSGRALDIKWVDYTGTDSQYSKLNIGTMMDCQTYVGHPWRVVDKHKNSTIQFVLPIKEPLEVHIRDSFATCKFKPGSNKLVTVSAGRTISTIDSVVGTVVQTFVGHFCRVNDFVYSPDGKQLASVAEDCSIILWNADTTTIEKIYLTNEWARYIRFIENGTRLVSLSENGALEIWGLDSDQPIHKFATKAGSAYTCVCVSQDGNAIVLGDNTGALYSIVKRGNNWINSTSLKICSDRICAIEISPDGRKVACCDATGNIYTVARTSVSFKVIATLAHAHKAPPTCVTFAPNGIMFCTSAHDFTAKTWNFEQVHTVPPSTQILQHSSSVLKVACVPNKPTLMLSVSEEGELFSWNTKTSKLARKTIVEYPNIKLMEVDEFGENVLVVAGLIPIVYRIDTLVKISQFGEHDHNIIAISISAKKNVCVTSQLPVENKSLFLWDTRTGALVENLNEFSVGNGPVSCIKFATDSSYMLTGTRNGKVVLWNTENWRPTKEISAHTAAVLSCHIFDNSEFLLTLSEDQTCSVRHTDNIETASFTVTEHNAPVTAGDIDRTNTLAATSSTDGIVVVWSLKDGKVIQRLEGHTEPVGQVKFFPASAFVATSSPDKTIRVWNTETGKQIAVFSTTTYCPTLALAGETELFAGDLSGRIYMLSLHYCP